MKTEDRWIIPVDLSNLDVSGLPIIGNSHIISILSTLETKPSTPEQAKSPAINLGPIQTEYKPEIEPISQLNSDTYPDASIKSTKKGKKVKPKTQYYIFCNFCPFLCLNNKRINEHLATVHGNNKIAALVPEYRCPACPNTLSHLSSLDSHLLHDHYVTNKSERKIIVHLIEQSKKYATYVPKSVHKKLENIKQTIVSDGFLGGKQEFGDVKNDDNSDSRSTVALTTTELPLSTDSGHVITLPTTDLSTKHTEQAINHSLLRERCQTRNSKVFSNADKSVEIHCKKSLLDIDDDDCILPETNIDSDLDKSEQLSDKSNVDLPTGILHRCTRSACNVRMRSNSKLLYHQKCHSDMLSINKDPFLVCPECAMEFSQWKPLTGHLWRIHRIDMELYRCNQCDYRTFNLSKLNNTHKLTHGDVRNYSCTECSRAFKNVKQLRNHKVLHKRSKDAADANTYTCDICEKVFAEKRKLKLHKDSVHMKLKPFLCSYCGYKGATRSALKLHSRQHTGEKPFVCTNCDFASADHNSLRRHKLRHSGKRPYKCVHCDYSCIQSSTYKVHLKTKHPGLEKDLLFACTHCSFRSVNKYIYLSHLLSVHGE